MKRRLREDPFGWRSASQLGQLQLAWSSPEWVGLATSLWQSAGRYPDAHGICRRIFLLAARSSEGPLTEPTAGVQPARQELAFMPQSGHCLRSNADSNS